MLILLKELNRSYNSKNSQLNKNNFSKDVDDNKGVKKMKPYQSVFIKHLKEQPVVLRAHLYLQQTNRDILLQSSICYTNPYLMFSTLQNLTLIFFILLLPRSESGLDQKSSRFFFLNVFQVCLFFAILLQSFYHSTIYYDSILCSVCLK